MYVQIVKFKLRPDIVREAFLEMTALMIAWLKDQEGFVSYELYESADCWIDRISWESARHAEAGLKEFLSTPIAQHITQAIEADHSSFFGEAVVSACR